MFEQYEIVVSGGSVVSVPLDVPGLDLDLGSRVRLWKSRGLKITHDALEGVINKYNSDYGTCLWSFCEEDGSSRNPDEWNSDVVFKITIDQETRYYEVV